MSSLVDVVLFNPVAAGTADFVVSAARLGYLTPAAAAAVNGATYSYRAESADLAQWEVGRGVWNAGSDTLTRAVVLYNSLGNTAKINFTLVPQVGLVALATDVAALDGIAHYTNTTEATGVGTTYAARFEGGVEFAKKVFITGGVGVGGALNVGGNIVGSEIFAGAASFAYGVRGLYSIASGTNYSYMFWGNATNNERARIQVTDSRQLVFSLDNGATNHLLVTTTNVNIPMTAAATSGSTGALTVAGGVGVSGAVYANGGVIASGDGIALAAYHQTVRANCYYDGAWKYLGNGLAWGMGNNFSGGSSATTIAVAATNASGANAALSWNPVLDIAPTQVKVIPNTASSSTTTGALIVGGGVGVAGALNIGGAFNAVGTVNQMGFFGSSQSLAYLTVAGSAGNIIFGASGTTAFLQNSFGTAIIEMQASGSAVTADVRGGGFTATSPSLGVGYRTGAGSTGTQATNKSTTVVPSKNCNCGQITMNAAALAAATIVSFSFTDTSVVATDVIVINHVSGGTLGAYTVNARAAAGSFTVDVRNNTGGSLSEALVLQFAVVKSVNA